MGAESAFSRGEVEEVCAIIEDLLSAFTLSKRSRGSTNSEMRLRPFAGAGRLIPLAILVGEAGLDGSLKFVVAGELGSGLNRVLASPLKVTSEVVEESLKTRLNNLRPILRLRYLALSTSCGTFRHCWLTFELPLVLYSNCKEVDGAVACQY